eukprot:6454766-Amphidinium_carterae.2
MSLLSGCLRQDHSETPRVWRAYVTALQKGQPLDTYKARAAKRKGAVRHVCGHACLQALQLCPKLHLPPPGIVCIMLPFQVPLRH